ncbi:MAG TPA: choice-of-anchor tandem repeat GloVer-containing protein [Rhizomicrobium sp.]|nr:choice-of-anchor tandem repeat GloVer-containing protein [Rhizomicrobium sp.]
MTARADSTRLVATVALCTLAATFANASTEKLLYSFPAGAYVVGRPDQDSKGALYGTAEDLDGFGAIFRLKQKNGIWSSKTLFDFNGNRGAYPWAGPLIDRTTNILYGTTIDGGNSGEGAVYSLAPAGRGWNQTVLHNFIGSDGAYPYGVLLKDKATGNLYGTTNYGATANCGTAFQLSQSNGSWTFSTIYNFQGGGDACQPFTPLRPGAKAGTLIGASSGAIFQLKESRGVWSDSIVHSFMGTDGANLWDLDASTDGSIYGVANTGGQYGDGLVFKLTPNLKNKYIYSVIYTFRGDPDGAYPVGINFDAATGNLYGTTSRGGEGGHSVGTVFRLAPSGSSWTETVLHSFTAGPSDGAYPYSRPIVDRTTGALYGTTTLGGVNNGGTVYMVQP